MTKKQIQFELNSIIYLLDKSLLKMLCDNMISKAAKPLSSGIRSNVAALLLLLEEG